MTAVLITIFHTNDFHNGLTEAQAERLRQLRASIEGQGVLVDAGDAVGSGNITFRPGGEPIHDLMNRAGFDLGTIGNREFHFSKMGFHAKLSRSTFPLLCANVRAVGEEPLPVVPHHLLELQGGGRLLFVGLTVPMITERMLSRKVSSYVFSEPIKTASAVIPQLCEAFQPDLVVALTHIGLRQDRLLAERVPGIDLIIGGHSHDTLEEGERVGDCLIVQTGSHAHRVGKVLFDPTNPQGTLLASLEAL